MRGRVAAPVRVGAQRGPIVVVVAVAVVVVVVVMPQQEKRPKSSGGGVSIEVGGCAQRAAGGEAADGGQRRPQAPAPVLHTRTRARARTHTHTHHIHRSVAGMVQPAARVRPAGLPRAEPRVTCQPLDPASGTALGRKTGIRSLTLHRRRGAAPRIRIHAKN